MLSITLELKRHQLQMLWHLAKKEIPLAIDCISLRSQEVRISEWNQEYVVKPKIIVPYILGTIYINGWIWAPVNLNISLERNATSLIFYRIDINCCQSINLHRKNILWNYHRGFDCRRRSGIAQLVSVVSQVWLWSNLTSWYRGFKSHPMSHLVYISSCKPMMSWVHHKPGQAFGHQLNVLCQELPLKSHWLLVLWHLAEKERPLAIDCNYLQWDYFTQVARGQNIKYLN